MRILNFGSLNIDHVYRVDHFVRPGESLVASSHAVFPGGKGLNQSIALARAGAAPAHAGCIGPDGAFLRALLAAEGADTSRLRAVDAPTGHAIIQVEPGGQNCILVEGGANRRVDPAHIPPALLGFGPGDTLLIQNEISSLEPLIRAAHAAGLRIFFNPGPFDASVHALPLHLIGTFLVNEIEGAELAGAHDPDGIVDTLLGRHPDAAVVLTLGADGVLYGRGAERIRLPAKRVPVVDTTAAGDTFIGFYLADLALGRPPRQALETAIAASALCVSRPGAAPSIPKRAEI